MSPIACSCEIYIYTLGTASTQQQLDNHGNIMPVYKPYYDPCYRLLLGAGRTHAPKT